MYADWNVGGSQALVENYWHRDIVWRDSPSFPDPGVYHGAEEAARRLDGFVDVIGHFQIAIIDAREYDDRVLVEIELQIQGQRSGVAGQMTLFHVLRLAADRVTEFWVCRDRDEAAEVLAPAT
jgi:hypothetical protein